MKICEEYASLLDSLLDGELDEETAARVRAHAASCPACAAYLADAAALRAVFGSVEDVQPPDGFADGVMAAVRANAAPRKKPRRWLPAFLSLAACAAVAVTAVRLVPFGAGSSSASAAVAAPSAAPFAAPAAGAASDAPASSLAESAENGGDAETSAETTCGLAAPQFYTQSMEPGEPAQQKDRTVDVSGGVLCAYPPQPSDGTEYALRAVFTAAEAGSALDGYAGEDRCDDSGRTYAAYELSRAEFDGVIDALDAADRVTEDGGGEDAPCLIAVYP